MTTITVRFVHEPKQAPDPERVDPSRVSIVGENTTAYQRLMEYMLNKARENANKAFGIMSPTEFGESIGKRIAEGIARREAIEVEPIGGSECKPPSALTVRK